MNEWNCDIFYNTWRNSNDSATHNFNQKNICLLQRYSIWAGTALIILAAALAGYGLFGSQDRNILLFIFAAVLLLFVIFLDIRRTKIGAGLLALLVQVFLAAFFVIIILITLLFICLRLFRGKHSNYSNNSCNRSMQTALSVFAHSFIPW